MAIPTSSSGFDPEFVLAKYPIPIALTFKTKLQPTQSPLHRLLGLTDVFEVSLKYCAIIAIQEYLRMGVRSTRSRRRQPTRPGTIRSSSSMCNGPSGR